MTQTQKKVQPKVGLTQKQANSGTSPIQQAAEKEKSEKGSEVTPDPEQNPEVTPVTPEEADKTIKTANKKMKLVDKATYDRYIKLKFLELSGTKLKEEHVKELANLEKILKACKGTVPIRTVTAAIDNEIVRLVEGVPLPEAYAKIIVACKNPAYYIG